MRIIPKFKTEVSLDLESSRPLALKRCNFHESIKFVIVMAQFFGVMPLHNIGKSSHEVTFRWKSYRFFYSIFHAAAALVNAAFWVVKFSVHGFFVDKTAQMTFYVCTSLLALQLIHIARNWPNIIKGWSYVDMCMRSYGNQIDLKKKFVSVTLFFMTLETVEHLLFIMNGIFQARKCADYSGYPAKAVFEVSFSNYFSIVTFSEWAAVIVKFSNTISTFTWIFSDLLISLTSIALTARFSQIVKKLEKNKVMHERFWREIREDYQKLFHLSKTVENHLALLVFVSYMHNMIFICIQLYNSLRERTGMIETLYFFYSFGFVVLRLIAVSMFCAWLNEEARKPLEFLYAVPSEYYCTEIRRLTEQIYTNPVGITGSGFFLVNKNFLLQMAGTIITLELMIFQFVPVKQQKTISTSYDCIT